MSANYNPFDFDDREEYLIRLGEAVEAMRVRPGDTSWNLCLAAIYAEAERQR